MSGELQEFTIFNDLMERQTGVKFKTLKPYLKISNELIKREFLEQFFMIPIIITAYFKNYKGTLSPVISDFSCKNWSQIVDFFITIQI